MNRNTLNDRDLANLAVRFLADEAASTEAVSRLGSRLLGAWQFFGRYAPTASGWFAITAFAALCVGKLFDLPVLEGAYLGAPPPQLLPVALLALLGLAILLLREGRGLAPVLQAFGTGLAATVSIIALLLLVTSGGNSFGVALVDSSLWGTALRWHLVAVVLLGLALASADWDAPRYRWASAFVSIAGIGVLASLVAGGYEVGSLIETELDLDRSLISAAALVALFAGFVFLRSDRGLAAIVLDDGPGSAATRVMIPTALVLVLLVGLLDYLTRDLSGDLARLGDGSTQITILFVLLVVTYVLSQHLQRYFRESQVAGADLADRAAILENLFEGVGVVGVDDRKIIFSNRRLEQLLGYDEGELVGLSLKSLIPDDETADETALREASTVRLTGDGSTVDTLRSARKDGSSVWGRSAAMLTESFRYGPVIVWSFSDISEEYRARREKEESDQLFRQVFDRSPIGLSMVRADHSFETVNPAFCRITGYSEVELLSMTFDDITHPGDLARDRELSADMFGGGSTGSNFEKRYVRKDGEIVWVRLSSAPLRGDGDLNDMALSMVEDVTARRKLTDELEFMADHDALTGVFNRRRLGRELEEAVSQRHSSGGSVALLLLDLDNFKFINDRYGHSVGDRLVVATADLITRRLRSSDTLARQGGDEFVILLRDSDLEGAMEVAREIVELIAREVRIETEEVSARITASIGVAFCGPGDDLSDETLLKRADIAMYEAKEGGRNAVKLYDSAEETSMERGVDWTDRITSALENDDFAVFAQPILSLSGEVEPGFEIFIRMRGEDGSLHPAGAFLPVAERRDLIQGIDRWMICRAISLLAGQAAGGIRARLWVNLSGRSLGDRQLMELIASELDRTGVDPSLLIFEVTETNAVRNVAEARTFTEFLADLGCGVALGGFGSGFASVLYLKTIDRGFVKIDGELIRSMARDQTSRFVVSSMIKMAQGLGKLTVAEMVEDRETFELLRGVGVDYVQGNLIGRPEPVDDIDVSRAVEWPEGLSPEADQ